MIPRNFQSSPDDRPLSQRSRSPSFGSEPRWARHSGKLPGSLSDPGPRRSVQSGTDSHPIYPIFPIISLANTRERVKEDELPDPSGVARRVPVRLHGPGRVAHPALEPPAPSSVRQAVLATIGIDPMKVTIENADDDRHSPKEPSVGRDPFRPSHRRNNWLETNESATLIPSVFALACLSRPSALPGHHSGPFPPGPGKRTRGS